MLKVLGSIFKFMLLSCGVAFVILLLRAGAGKHESSFTHDEVARINPVLIVDKYTLLDPANQAEELKSALNRMVGMGVLIQTPFGPIINPDLKYGNYAIPIIIESNGGLTKLGMKLIGVLNSLREAGIKVNCYVGEAQSMAFSLMVISCDKVIAKKTARLMQHRISYEAAGTTPSTYQSDIELSRLESQALGLKFDHWHQVARGPEDHVFTKEETEKYKLVDEWID